MLMLPGYIISEQIYEGVSSLVFKGFRESDKKPIIIKLLKTEYPSVKQLTDFECEYQILSSLQKNTTVTAYALIPYGKSLAIVMEQLGDASLKEWLVQHRFNLKESLAIALDLVKNLEEIHHQQIIHKDINSSNILWDNQKKMVKIIDFGISSRLARENPEIQSIQALEGMLAYISPEQTGRMNRSIDYRSDYYSLGVVFYELFTGILPFLSNDPIELVHCHIAKIPQAPHKIDATIPEVVSNIILKLMSKTAEARYQSIYGIKADLQQCITQLQIKGRIDNFSLGENDIDMQFHIPEKLYGREQETNILLKAFERVSTASTELILVDGDSGIGKSSLIHELNKLIIEKRGYFIAGKFAQLKCETPYAPLIQAIQELIRQILTESEEQINQWRLNIMQALGKNGQVVLDVIPNLIEIIGPQPEVFQLPTIETQNRFNIVFQNFFHSLTRSKNPLVLFLDDMQWVDNPSLHLLEILSQNADCLLVITAYRKNEMDSTHPFYNTLTTIKNAGIKISQLSLNSLELGDIEQLLADTLHREKETVTPLAKICIEKTRGNPFFLNQFLHELYKKHLIQFDTKQGKWCWDVVNIQQQGFTNNVIELMAEKVNALNKTTQNILSLSACLGNQFNLKSLATIYGKSVIETADELWIALQENLIMPVGDAYKFVNDSLSSMIRYQFSHDRVQQVAYELISPEERAKVHLHIGRLLLNHAQPNELSEQIINIVNHLNFGLSLVQEQEEKRRIANLNFQAGKKAKTSIAYQAALHYFQKSIYLLGEKSWEEDYDFTLTLYKEAATSAYLTVDFAMMETFCSCLLEKARNLIDKIDIYILKIEYLAGQDKFKDAITLGFTVLKLLGVNPPKNSGKLQLLLEFIRCKITLFNKKLDKLEYLPAMQDTHWEAVIRVMSRMSSSIYSINTFLFLILGMQILELSVKRGNNHESANAYFIYSIILFAITRDIKQGIQFGELSLKTANRFSKTGREPRTLMGFYVFISHWGNSLKKSLLELQNTLQYSLESGNLETAGYCASSYIMTAMYAGLPLIKLEKELQEHCQLLEKLKQKTAYHYAVLHWETGRQLLDCDSKDIELFGKIYTEEKLIHYFTEKKDNLALAIFFVSRIVTHYLFDQSDIAYQYIAYAKNHLMQMSSQLLEPTFDLFSSLAALNQYPTLSIKERINVWWTVKSTIRKFKRWSQYAPFNFIAKYYLLLAEYARVQGKMNKAIKYFELAINSAKDNGLINDEALANECAAKLFLNLSKNNSLSFLHSAKVYMHDAYHCYQLWGAFAKLKQLKTAYPHLLLNHGLISRNNISITGKSISQTHSMSKAEDILDLSSIMKAAQSLSQEIVFSDFLKKMIHIVIENAGAERGLLLLEKENQWYIEAEGTLGKEPVVLQSISITNKVPINIINYVIHSKKSIVIDDVVHHALFAIDNYFKEKNIKSILCMPLINHDSLKGILYLENNLTTYAFAKNRLDIINMLSTQIVISMDNARLYSDTIILNENLSRLNKAQSRFVPTEFLALLGKKSITDVGLGDQTQKEMTVMFADIRNFTMISEKMNPAESFAFINEFLGHLEPIISTHNGFVDKYLGDGIMALFPSNADDALQAGIAMLHVINQYNEARKNQLLFPVHIGIGLNSGLLMLGTVGGEHRMDGTVISDTVNLTSRIQDLTKLYKTPMLITEETYLRLQHIERYHIRKIDTATIRGKTKHIAIYEIFNSDSPTCIALKKQTALQFENAIMLYNEGNYTAALNFFKQIMQLNANDYPASIYHKRCLSFSKSSLSSNDAAFRQYKI